jgi:hypothetical protein
MELSPRVHHSSENSYSRVLKKADRPLHTIRSFALEFIPKLDGAVLPHSDVIMEIPSGQESAASEVPTISIHALDVFADINVKKNPQLARKCLTLLAEKYDPLRKGYWEFRMNRL